MNIRHILGGFPVGRSRPQFHPFSRSQSSSHTPRGSGSARRSPHLGHRAQHSGVLLGFLAGVCATGLWSLGMWQPLERSGYNALFQLRERLGFLSGPGWDSRIAVIAIDEPSLAAYGQFPWSRDRYAALLDQLLFVQPAAVGFDVFFAESTAHDAQLADSISASGNVVLAIAGVGAGQTIDLAPGLKQGAAGTYLLGHANNWADVDGISRQTALYESQYPSLGLAMLQVCQAITTELITATPETEIPATSTSADPLADCAMLQLPTVDDRQSTRWINWPGSVAPIPANQFNPAQIAALAPTQTAACQTSQSLCVYSFADVADGTIDPEVFANKVVLVGYTATGIDPARTPLNMSPPTAGVYVHAAVLDNLLNDNFLNKPPQWSEPLLLMGLALMAGLLLNHQQLRGRIVLTLLLPIAWGGVGLLAFIQTWWLPLAAPMASILMTAAFIQLREQRDKQQLMALFAKHVAPETAQLIWQRREELITQGRIEPQELTATVLFMDIRNFTGISEQLSSKQLLDWLNDYFEAMTDCIMQHGGVVDKYIGDAIMAVFGVPFPSQGSQSVRQDAIAAISASIAMHQRLATLNQYLRATHQPPIQFGIGLHTGPVIAGTVGNRQRLNYSIFGDTVNIAARLEAQTKTLPSNCPYRVLMTEDTYTHIQDEYPGQVMDTVTLRGRQAQTTVYTLAESSLCSGRALVMSRH